MLAGLTAFALAGHAAAQSPAPANPPAPKTLPMPNLSQASALCRNPTANPNLRVAACDVVIQLNQNQVTPENLAIAYSNRCAAYQAVGQYDAANADCDQAIKLDPGSAGTFATRCEVLNNKGLYDDALKDCDRAAKLDPNYATAFYDRGLVHDNKQEFDAAIVQDFRCGQRKLLGKEARVVRDQQLRPLPVEAKHMLRNRGHGEAHVRECEVLADNGAPTGGSEMDWRW